MLAHLTPKERAGYVGIAVLILSFAAFVGSKKIHQPAPIAIQTRSSPRVVQGEAPPDKPALKHPAHEAVAASKKPTVLIVDVVGAVKREGVYHLPADSRVVDAIQAAGGPDGADEDQLNLAAKLEDGVQVRVPKFGAVAATPQIPAPTSYSAGESKPISNSRKSGKNPTEPLDLNAATLEQLETIPGVGPSTASRILDYRKEHGSFNSVEELTSVGGIGPKKLERMRTWLHV